MTKQAEKSLKDIRKSLLMVLINRTKKCMLNSK